MRRPQERVRDVAPLRIILTKQVVESTVQVKPPAITACQAVSWRLHDSNKKNMPRPNPDQRRKHLTETNLDTGAVILEKYVLAGRLHRDPFEGPALIERHDDGRLRQVEYHFNGRLHREDGPARVRYGSDGAVVHELYCLFGKVHRDPTEGPAYIARRDDGGVESEIYSSPDEAPPKPPRAWQTALAGLRRPAP